MFGLRTLLLLGGVLFVIVGFAYFFYNLQPASLENGSAYEGLGTGIRLRIVKGESFKEIGAHLSQESLIKSIGVFKMYAIVTGKAQKFQPGVYTLSRAMSVPEIVALLTRGGRNEIAVTIPEGSTLRDIDGILAEKGVLQKNALISYSINELKSLYPFLEQISSLEGFLFPDTYRFHIDTSPDVVVRTFLDNFEEKAWPLLSDVGTWYDYLILASFLEREVPSFEDRKLVSGILLRRLQLGMPFQVDATISYAKCGGAIKECENIAVTQNDLTIVSPFNTYRRLGWTPTPIANPGELAMKAALNPTASPYLFYLSARETGETIYAKTFEEHRINRSKYL